MKKFFLYLLLSAGTLSSSAQTLLDGNMFLDNWSVGVRGGTVTPTDP